MTEYTPNAARLVAFIEAQIEKDVARAAEQRALLHSSGSRHLRAGYTTSKNRGTPKGKRRMAKASRVRNRGKS